MCSAAIDSFERLQKRQVHSLDRSASFLRSFEFVVMAPIASTSSVTGKNDTSAVKMFWTTHSWSDKIDLRLLTSPGGLPILWVVVRKGQANLFIDLESSTWLGREVRARVRYTFSRLAGLASWHPMTYSEKHNVGGLHGVLVGQTDESVVDPTIVIRLCRPSNREVPLERLVFKGFCVRENLLFRRDVLELLHYSLHRQG